MMKRFLMMLLVGGLLSGCFWKYQPANLAQTRDIGVEAGAVPPLVNSEAALQAWVDYGLAAQRNDQEWREKKMSQIDIYDEQTQLAQAVLLSWGSERQWEKAAALYEAGLPMAPPKLEPLFRYWMNDLKRRRELLRRLYYSESRRQPSSVAPRQQRDSSNVEEATELEEVKRKLKETTEKLDALTDIEKNINQRQSSP
ncbi:hypothetical protein [Pistricoccus aurantiacus]|uniref:Uncharacterized protein n=1 Tax=Pistricoccus aurantiacus TaxID=1883414 RepID=A0A5B8SMD5_9GAMM|nr:hypothetical protein [Pistricoccus aurantiacus]QEA37906.1 hypothetical protein FGL86_01685 [Pistricoccus aurantiacus]